MIVSAAWDPFGSLITAHLGKGPGRRWRIWFSSR